MRKLQFILASCTLVLSLAYAIAGVEVINFPVGESLHSGPNAVLLKQLQVRDASPASGSVTIGEITAKWETEGLSEWTCFVSGTSYPQFDCEYLLNADSSDEGSKYFYHPDGEQCGSCKVSLYIEDGDTEGEKKFETYGSFMSQDVPDSEAGWGFTSTNLPESVDTIVFVVEGVGGFDGATITNVFRRNHIVINHATTNALWTVTAAGGSAVTNFPANSYEYLKPGIDWVRYGTATGGFVRLFVED